jgi:hypothetical protein
LPRQATVAENSLGVTRLVCIMAYYRSRTQSLSDSALIERSQCNLFWGVSIMYRGPCSEAGYPFK